VALYRFVANSLCGDAPYAFESPDRSGVKMDSEREKFTMRAKELRELAARISYEPDRKALIQVAEEYERLAGHQVETTVTNS
jgi:hypothetical protein